MSYYAVLADHPFSAGPDDQQETVVYGRLDQAVQHADQVNRDGGMPRRVYRVEAVPDHALYDWAVQRPDFPDPTVYVNEHTARNCVGRDGQLLRRRLGSDQWEPVTA